MSRLTCNLNKKCSNTWKQTLDTLLWNEINSPIPFVFEISIMGKKFGFSPLLYAVCKSRNVAWIAVGEYAPLSSAVCRCLWISEWEINTVSRPAWVNMCHSAFSLEAFICVAKLGLFECSHTACWRQSSFKPLFWYNSRKNPRPWGNFTQKVEV